MHLLKALHVVLTVKRCNVSKADTLIAGGEMDGEDPPKRQGRKQ